MDIRYCAGLFDGEGFIRIATYRKSAIHLRMQLYCGIGVTHRPIMEEMHRQFGGSLHCNDHSRRNIKHRPQWMWLTCSQDSAKFLRQIQPHLVIKKDEVDLALEFQASIDKWRGKLGTRNPQSMTEEREAVWAYRRDLARRIFELKHIRYNPSDPVSSAVLNP